MLPASCVFKGEVKVTEEFSHIVYGTAPEVTRELWKGTWVETNEKVAIKVIGIGQDVAFYPEKSKEVCLAHHLRSLQKADPYLVAIV